MTSRSIFDRIAAAVDQHGQLGITPELKALLDELGASHRDTSDGFSSEDKFAIQAGNTVIVLDHHWFPQGDTMARTFLLRQAEPMRSREWEF